MIPFKTKSEQKLEWLTSLKRPLTDLESEELRKSMHAVYCRDRKAKKLAQHRNEEMRLLKQVMKEARAKEWYPNEC